MRVAAEHVSKAYGFLWALRDVSLEFTGGEFVLLLGANGAGKTTLLKVLAFLLDPTSGEIRWDGQRCRRGRPQLQSVIGLFSPAEHLYENLTVEENLRFFSALYGRKTAPAELRGCLERVALSGRMSQQVGCLSAGMKSRLSIAKWMLLEPSLLLLDEPYATLDQNGAHLLESFLSDRVRAGAAVIMATHQPSRAAPLCSRAVLLEGGRLVSDDSRPEAGKRLDPLGGEPSRGALWRS